MPNSKRNRNSFVLLYKNTLRQYIVLLIGGVIIALITLMFTKASNAAFSVFLRITSHSIYWALILTPCIFGLLAWITTRGLESTRGSGIPQVIAGLRGSESFCKKNFTIPIATAKLMLTVLGLFGGASIGREGPTVHIGAAIMRTLHRLFRLSRSVDASRFLLAGGAAGIAAAFNTPIAGVMFAIEELSSSYKHHFSSSLLIVVIVSGVISLELVGNYTYFGTIETTLSLLNRGWLAIIFCGVFCGLAGGIFSRILLNVITGQRSWIGQLQRQHPIITAVGFGILLATLGVIFGNSIFGTGYEQARALLQGQQPPINEFGIVKLVANLASFLAGIPGGLFSPALAVGAGFGYNISSLFPGIDPSAIVLLGMAAYLCGVTQAPLTSIVISMEITNNHQMALPILITVLIAQSASALVCKTPIYRGIALQLLPKQTEKS